MPRNTEIRAGTPVLLIEDDQDLAGEIRAELETVGHTVRHASTAEEGLAAAREGAPAILVVDRMLDGVDGLTIVQTLRQEGNAVPVIVISGLSGVDDRILGLKAGGDDYLVKPFALPELSARVEALLRRVGDNRATRLHVGALEMDLVDREVRCDGVPIELLPREFKLLEYFMRRPTRIITRAMLLTDVWEFKFLPQTNVVDVHIGNLRRKLDAEDHRRFIVNVRAAGFKLNAES
jgi:two-component system, OmpR family, response regulator